jgi:ribose 5-phosphate isomerase A
MRQKWCLDSGKKTPVSVEVVSQALALAERLLKDLGGRTKVWPDQSKAGPVVTDVGNLIIDVEFGVITDAKSLEQKINCIPGIVSNGLFLDMVDEVVIGSFINGQMRVERRSFQRN